jgi:hypothetical protein
MAGQVERDVVHRQQAELGARRLQVVVVVVVPVDDVLRVALAVAAGEREAAVEQAVDDRAFSVAAWICSNSPPPSDPAWLRAVSVITA